MLHVPRAVEGNSFQFLLTRKNIVIVFNSAKFLNILPGVAQIRPSLRHVLLVVAQAQPAKLVMTQSACHVHTALILFDIFLAPGTGLRIQFNPRSRIV